MAASGGGLAPTPPKRPTIIRPRNETGHPVPSKPAPPLPGGGRKVPAVPDRTNATDSVPSRPQPPPPSRPAALTRQEPPPPSRASGIAKPEPPPPSRAREIAKPEPQLPSKSTEAAKTMSMTEKLSRALDRSNSSAVKKRPQITVVSARPMSEIGFRETKPSVPANNSADEDSLSQQLIPSGEDGTAKTVQPPAPAPRTSPMVDKQEDLDVTDSRVFLRGPPPPVPRNSLGKKNEEIIVENERFKEVTHRGPPPPVPRPTVIKPNVPPSGVLLRQPPSVPGRPPASPKEPVHDFSSEHLSEQKLNYNESHHISPPRSHGVPPPVPRSPSIRNKLPSPKGPHHSDNISQKDTDEIHHQIVERNPGDDSNVKPEKIEDFSELYAVINKPKRPTIIRPSRPKPEPEQKLNSEIKTDDEIKPRISPTPRVSRNVESNIESNVINLEDTNQGHSEFSDGNPVPEFLRKKLKPTLDLDGKSEAGIESPTAGSGPTVPLKPRPVSSRGPPPATKPKPSVLPKPQVAVKPHSTMKAFEVDKHDKALDTKTENERKEKDDQAISSQSGQAGSDISEVAQQVKPAVVKRPTIIRPSRSGKFGSVENVCQESSSEKRKSYEHIKPYSDDSAIESMLRPQPPLPNKRPVSMINIHKTVESEDKHISQNSNAVSSKSSENVSEPLRPKPSPRPAARSRPASVMVLPVSRPPLPSAGPKFDKSSLPPRPKGGPPARPSAPDIEQHDVKMETGKEKADKSASPRLPFGVSVFPRPETEHSGPPKPVRRPPPPKSSPQKTSDSSEEEFVTAKEKPDRPSAGPSKEASGSVRRESSGDETVKPPRPGALPPPHKGSATGSPDKGVEEDDPVKRRPFKPEARPQRPMSMPVKQILPSKPQPARPQGPRSGKKGLPPLPTRPKPGHPLYFHMMQVPHGIALHDYSAQHDDEVSFKTGDLIVFERRIDSDWIMGKVDDWEGMFPQDFVKVKMPLPGEKLGDDDSSNDSAEIFYDASPEKPDNIGHGPRCRARFDFDGEGLDDLVFEEGDVIRLIERVGLEWRKGEINGRIGLFPLLFVEIIEDLPEEKEIDTGSFAKAIFDFDGEEGDLNFQAGESIKVTHMVNEEWLFGEIGNKKGQFPVQFVDHVPHELPLLSSSAMDAKGDYSTMPQTGDKLSTTLAMWDDHVDHVLEVNSTGVTPSGDMHTSGSQNFVSMAMGSVDTPYCIATYDYPPQTDEDLGFSEGDHIELVERISADWLKGKLGDKIGIFPSAFVDIKVDIDTTGDHAPVSKQEVTETYGIALYEFIGEADNELTFRTGDRFVVQDLVEGAEDWRWGIVDGHRGMFPAAFVQVES